ncbi:VanW family protein [Leptospira ellisii]|uniref:VanW family protein n=1 Tax=Leptospira ellisii TaxID=2023197 RepID=A0AAE4TY14_9LEPT|nr:VanW family protein [Leptospira ellisii]MDV6235072.1 VanW family protein [Leptospira ellisii]
MCWVNTSMNRVQTKTIPPSKTRADELGFAVKIFLLQGFVLGRGIREGCIIPSIAGGICKISNALYDVAVRSGFEVLERHRHSFVIPGSLAEQNGDTTVKWNSIYLRFRSGFENERTQG